MANGQADRLLPGQVAHQPPGAATRLGGEIDVHGHRPRSVRADHVVLGTDRRVELRPALGPPPLAQRGGYVWIDRLALSRWPVPAVVAGGAALPVAVVLGVVVGGVAQ